MINDIKKLPYNPQQINKKNEDFSINMSTAKPRKPKRNKHNKYYNQTQNTKKCGFCGQQNWTPKRICLAKTLQCGKCKKTVKCFANLYRTQPKNRLYATLPNLAHHKSKRPNHRATDACNTRFEKSTMAGARMRTSKSNCWLQSNNEEILRRQRRTFSRSTDAGTVQMPPTR